MPSMKDLRNRIRSVRSTQKITAAMKIVAASKLRRAQQRAVAARPYAERMKRVLASLASRMSGHSGGSKLLTGAGSDQTHLLVVATSDRGLAGGFNASILREVRRQIRALTGAGKEVKIFTIGRKGRDGLRRDYAKLIVDSLTDVGRRGVSFEEARDISQRILVMFAASEFDVCSIVYNRFHSVLTQIITVQQLIPVAQPEATHAPATDGGAIYEFEPDEEEILADLLPRNLAAQVHMALLESAASEEGARMTAMDNATRNAGEMIDRLTLTFNRTRQANITRELIEIVSGAEALRGR